MCGLSVSTDPAARHGAAKQFRIMVVDDSAVIRGLISRWLQIDPAIRVVASAGSGVTALTQAKRHRPEVIVLDIEMPEMDGMTALPRLLEIDPDVKIIMASTLTTRNAKISFAAIAAGAADYIPKPSTTRDAQASTEFQNLLLEKVKALGAAHRLHAGSKSDASIAARATVVAKPAAEQSGGLYGSQPIVLRQAASALKPQALGIGSSTGGPKALFEVFGYLKASIKLPIFITQHMPAMFTTILAEHLRRITDANCSEPSDQEPVVDGNIYIAPGDWHMVVESRRDEKIIRLNQEAPENYCRPAVDPMFRSLAKAYGGRVLGVILTGMGHDGMLGAEKLVRAGGTVMAQNESSSVVWGMPEAVATGGLCSAVLPLTQVGPAIERLVAGEAS